jgi:hypothetical protein
MTTLVHSPAEGSVSLPPEARCLLEGLAASADSITSASGSAVDQRRTAPAPQRLQSDPGDWGPADGKQTNGRASGRRSRTAAKLKP